MKKSLIISVILGVVLIVIIFINYQKFEILKYEDRNNQSSIFQNQGLGTLCSTNEECISFCQNNLGQCEDYCKGNENKLCKIIFSFDEEGLNIDNTEKETYKELEEIKEDKPSVLKNLGVNIDAWNKQTNLAGDLLFTKDLLFDDGNIMNEWVFVEFGGTGQRKSDPLGSNIEYWFFVPLGTKLRAPVDGIIQVVFFNHTQDWGINFYSDKGNNWIVSFEHVVNLVVKEGDVVKAGDIIAEAASRINKEIAMVELAVWRHGSGEIYKFCPFEFLDESLKPIYEEKINQLAKDWEEFIGKDVYQQEKWVAPGCLVEKIQER
ncbi:MAG: M23 family metallopeptidase [Nanoarchaeota archaeon]